jgi:hypothetical protein
VPILRVKENRPQRHRFGRCIGHRKLVSSERLILLMAHLAFLKSISTAKQNEAIEKVLLSCILLQVIL